MIRTFLWIVACLSVIVVVVLGAYTRLVDAGLGCPDWPTCYGHLWVPKTSEDVQTANLSFPETPVEHDKTWPEQTHRIFASLLGVLIVGLYCIIKCSANRARGTRVISVDMLLMLALIVSLVVRIVVGSQAEWLCVSTLLLYCVSVVYRYRAVVAQRQLNELVISILLAAVILQGLFGMWTVTLKLWPQVVTAHLLGGFTILTLITYATTRQLSSGRWESLFVEGRWRGLFTLVFVVVAIQVALGGWVSANYAAVACPDLPKCQNTWWPGMDLRQGFNVFQHVGPNYLGGMLDNTARIAIHFMHRLGAILVTLCILYAAFRLYRAGYGVLALAFIVTLGTQVSLGVANILLAVPLPVALSHNAVGAVLFALSGTCLLLSISQSRT